LLAHGHISVETLNLYLPSSGNKRDWKVRMEYQTDSLAMFTCSFCKNCSVEPLSCCSRCFKTYYCGPTCQLMHWKESHAKDCVSARNNNDERICGNCHKQSEVPFQRCSSCMRIGYCSKSCQKEHWKASHKAKCRPSLNQE
jgi:hypothetical protein